MIEAYGGDKWVHGALDRISGENASAKEAFKSDRAWEVYESLFTKRETIEGSCADYAGGADPEPQLQEEDQAEGRKIEVPVLVMWSLTRLGKMHNDVPGIWKSWVKEGVKLETVGCGDGVGHYLPEEASAFLSEHITKFINEVKK